MRIGSLCSGYGGLDLAVEQHLGGQVAWFAENDPHPATVYRRHWPHAPNLGDITTVDWGAVEPVDVITAGYPCTPFSVAGQRSGVDHEQHLWPHVRQAVGQLRPRLVVLENVEGHLSLGFDRVVADLAALGMHVCWGVVRASDAGAPHRRARLFIAAADADCERRREHRRAWSVPPELTAAQRRGTCSGCGEYTNVVGGDYGPQLCGGCSGWGRYTVAIHRWQCIVGRPSPTPAEPDGSGRPRLSARWVEWLMGLPDGWVTDPTLASDGDAMQADIFGGWVADAGVPRSAQLKMLGNGVVPQQAALALRLLEVA